MGTFFCVSAPSLVKEETSLLTESWGFSATYLDKLVKHTESMWEWVVKLSDILIKILDTERATFDCP